LFSDKHDLTVDQVKELVAKPDIISLPLYLYDHSGITMNTTGFSCPWDSGQVGYIYVSKADARKERIPFGNIKPILESEVETYNQYLTGEVYGYEILNVVRACIDSCCGFFGPPKDHLIPHCKAFIDSL